MEYPSMDDLGGPHFWKPPPNIKTTTTTTTTTQEHVNLEAGLVASLSSRPHPVAMSTDGVEGRRWLVLLGAKTDATNLRLFPPGFAPPNHSRVHRFHRKLDDKPPNLVFFFSGKCSDKATLARKKQTPFSDMLPSGKLT